MYPIEVRVLKNGEIHHPIVCVFWLPDRRIVLRDNDEWLIDASLPYAPDVLSPWIKSFTTGVNQKYDYTVTAGGEVFRPKEVWRFIGRRHPLVYHYRLIF